MDALKKHGEKIVFLLLVAGLAASLLLAIGEVGSLGDGVSPTGKRQGGVEGMDLSSFETTLSTLQGQPVRVQAPTNTLFTSEKRVACVNPLDRSLIPADMAVCVYCGADQNPIRDSDSDGLEDSIELKWGMDPNNAADIDWDMDQDGFTNLQEIQQGFDPTAATSHPNRIVHLRLQDVEHRETLLRMIGRARGPVSTTVQMEVQYPGSNRWEPFHLTKVGSTFGRENEFFAKAYEDKREPKGNLFIDVSEAIIAYGDKELRVRKNAPVAIRESTANLQLLHNPQWGQAIRIGQTFSLDGMEYKVIDIKRESVLLQDLASSEALTLKQPTAEELKPIPASGSTPAGSPEQAGWNNFPEFEQID